MKCILVLLAILLTCGVALSQEIGTASGNGVIGRFIPSSPDDAMESVPFSPKFSFAYKSGSGNLTSTWIVLTEKEPPLKEWMAATDREAARLEWCKNEKASFVAVKLDAKSAVDLYFLCPGNGQINTEMVSTANGLDSVIVKFDSPNSARLKGTIVGGEGSCPDEAGNNKYCTQKSDYSFDAPFVP